MSENLILGIDGGGTKTVAWIAPADAPQKAIGRGTSGSANLQVVGEKMVIGHLEQALEASFVDSGLPRQSFAAACIGLAGADREADQKIIRGWAEKRQLTDRLHLVNDALPVLFAANPSGCGIALISGTGSFAFGRRQDGTTTRVGGWGYLFGDEGSGYTIALDGLRASARSADGRGPATNLLRLMLAALGQSSAEDLIPTVYNPTMTRSQIAALCHVVFEAELSGDSVATEILDNNASSLAEMVTALAVRMQCASHSFPLALTGGVLLQHRELRDRLQSKLLNRGLSPDPIVVISDPVVGALIISQQALL